MGKTRGLLFYALGGEEMDVAVKKYRVRRDGRLTARGVRKDDEEENTNNKSGGEKTGGHGNTKLPFGLCKKYGIEYGEDWTPRDAWDALAGKGITPGREFARLSQGKKGVTTIKDGATSYSNLSASAGSHGRYALFGDMEQKRKSGDVYKRDKAQIHDFLNKDEMLAYLKEKGITRFKDPDSGEMVNPVKMDLPRTVGKIGEKRFTDMYLGVEYGGRIDKDTGKRARDFTIWGKDFGGKRIKLKSFQKEDDAVKYAEELGCKRDTLTETRDYKKYREGRKALGLS